LFVGLVLLVKWLFAREPAPLRFKGGALDDFVIFDPDSAVHAVEDASPGKGA
jgi:hypothetical protein